MFIHEVTCKVHSIKLQYDMSQTERTARFLLTSKVDRSIRGIIANAAHGRVPDSYLPQCSSLPFKQIHKIMNHQMLRPYKV